MATKKTASKKRTTAKRAARQPRVEGANGVPAHVRPPAEDIPPQAMADRMARGEKINKVCLLLKRQNGCTSKEVLELTGWPSVSMPAMAKACGLKLHKQKVKGRPIQYYGY